MFDYTLRILDSIETSIESYHSRSDVFHMLKELGLSDFGELMISIPNPRFPKLSCLLPSMASKEIQVNWTGNSGIDLLKQSIDFVRSSVFNYVNICNQSICGRRILDFGCGYGRLARIFYYFTDENNLYGIDPWDKSIQICKENGLISNYYVSDYLPKRLPIPDDPFDFIYAFSVFTHLSERATLTCLNTLANYIKKNGVICITIRPVEYWNVSKLALNPEKMKLLHNEVGFAFLPHNRPPIDGDITYGETSIDLSWLRNHFPHLKIVSIDRSLLDPYQIYVFIQKIN